MTFDQTLPTLLATCEQTNYFHKVERACAVRDIKGRIRLILQPNTNQAQLEVDALRKSLEQSISERLGKYFASPIWVTTSSGADGRIAREILGTARKWVNCQYTDPVSGRVVNPQEGRWLLMERRISKHSWLESGPVQMPWPLVKNAPPIVTFYSFKGGVGRTTSLVSCAWQLARAKQRVVIVDLDLEAPGLGALLEAEAERGSLDAIVDYLATGSVTLDGLHAPAQAFGAEDAGRVDVIAAGNLDISYLEKLARLDFLAATPWDHENLSPVESALRALVAKIRSELRPDYIFLDARAGLHDLAGLSLHGVSHVDVLVSRASEQAFRGLDLAVQALGVRKNADDLRCVVVHGFAPRDPDSEQGKLELEKFQQRTYDSFCDYIYENEPPAPADKTAAHWPWPLRQDPDLERFSSITSVQNNLFSEQHQQLLRRIEELCSPEQPPGEVNEAVEEVEN